jgi:hypothetical protein
MRERETDLELNPCLLFTILEQRKTHLGFTFYGDMDKLHYLDLKAFASGDACDIHILAWLKVPH